MTEIERSFLAAKGFNTNLVQYLPLYYVISNVHRHAPKWFCVHKILCTKNYKF